MKAPLAALLLGLLGCAHRRAPMAPAPPMAAEVVVLATEDGAAVQLHHHPAAGPPVLVVHGLGSRGQYFDLNEDQSLARALQGQGFDAWLLDLRGHGGLQQGADGRHLKAGWTLDDYGRYDIHAAIQHIQASTGHAQVGYIGHSMGGMALAIYQSWHGDAALAAVVILASPVDFGDPDPLLKAGGRAMLAGAALPSLHPEVFGGMAARTARLPLHAEAMLANMENLGADTWAAMVAHGTGPLSRGELLQLHQVVRSGCFCSMDGSRDYLRDLSQLTAPLLVFAGRADGIAPADRVKPFYDHAGSNHKAFEIAGRIHGYGADYGHLDLTAGRRAPVEIWPRIFAWFEGRWTDAPAPALPAADALQGQAPAAPAPPLKAAPPESAASFARVTRWRELALERVASGLRINRAADDAAGSGVATNLRTTEGSRVAALQNTRTAMEMVRVAESGLQEIEEHLQRMRELAMAAASETLADDERAYLDDELVERLDGIDDIAASTSFSGRGLLEGAGVDVAFLVDSSLSMVFEIGALQAAVSAFETYFSDANLDVRFSLTEINAGRDPLDGSRQLADLGDGRFQSALSGLTTTFGLQDPYTALMEVAGLASVTGTQDPDAVSFRVGSLERHLIVLSDDPRELDLLPGAETAASVGQALADAGFIVHAINAPAVDSTFSPIVAATGGSQYDAGNFGQFIDAALDDIAAVITDRVGESEPIEVQVGVGSDANSRITLGLPINATSSGLGVSNLDISTVDGARAALDSIDRALDRLNQGRSVLGASSRRLDAVEQLHADLGQALGAAESTIRDADLAEAISELTQAEIVADAAMAARSQARRLSLDAVKSLLG